MSHEAEMKVLADVCASCAERYERQFERPPTPEVLAGEVFSHLERMPREMMQAAFIELFAAHLRRERVGEARNGG